MEIFEFSTTQKSAKIKKPLPPLGLEPASPGSKYSIANLSIYSFSAVIGGAVVGLLCAILCVMFVVYRMRKKDEGSYALDEPKRSPTVNAYAKHPSREFYA